MERTYVVYYDDKGDPIFVVYDEYGDPMFKFQSMSRAQRKALQANLRTELAVWNQRLGELHREAEAEGKSGLEMHRAITDQASADGMPDYDLQQALDELEEFDTPVERVIDFLMTWGLWTWFGLLVLGAALRVAGVLRPHDWGGVYILGGFAIFGLAWLVSRMPERWG